MESKNYSVTQFLDELLSASGYFSLSLSFYLSLSPLPLPPPSLSLSHYLLWAYSAREYHYLSIKFTRDYCCESIHVPFAFIRYANKDQFASDVRLVFSNCEIYNEDESDVRTCVATVTAFVYTCSSGGGGGGVAGDLLVLAPLYMYLLYRMCMSFTIVDVYPPW